MKTEKKANVILFCVIIVLLVLIIGGLAYLYKALEYKIVNEGVNDLSNKDNYSYLVYEEKDLSPIYTLKYFNNKYRITRKGEPGFIEGDINKNDSIHFLPQKEAYTPIAKEENILEFYPAKITKKYSIIDFFKKDILRKGKRNGEEVIEFRAIEEDRVKIYTVETKNKTLREYKEEDKNGNVLMAYKYDITLGNITETDVEPIDRNGVSVKVPETFNNLKQELIEEIEKQKEEEMKLKESQNKEEEKQEEDKKQEKNDEMTQNEEQQS